MGGINIVTLDELGTTFRKDTKIFQGVSEPRSWTLRTPNETRVDIKLQPSTSSTGVLHMRISEVREPELNDNGYYTQAVRLNISQLLGFTPKFCTVTANAEDSSRMGGQAGFESMQATLTEEDGVLWVTAYIGYKTAGGYVDGRVEVEFV